MKTEVEQRIVEMRFENEQFEKAAKQSLSTLEKLDGVLDILGSQGGLERLSGVLDTVQRRFSTLGIAGAAAIEKITGKVLNLASNLLTAIPRQILSGGTTRATNLEQARFQLKGLGIAWEEVSDDMEYAVNGAAYGLDEAAKAASLLGDKLDHNVTYKIGEAGQEASELGHALRAISGVAAMTNSSYGDITDIFADAAALGRVTNDTLMRLSYRGMNATAALAKGLNKTEQEIQQMVRKGEISLKTFADVMDATYGQHAVDANETYAGSLMNMKAALSRIGADFITPWHEGLRKIQNGLRNMFNRVRTITRPFAEGIFTNWVEYFAAKIEKLSDSMQFDGLKAIVSLLSKVDLTWIGRGMDKLSGFIKSIRDLFTIRQKLENGQWATEFVNEKALARVEKIQKFWNGLRELGRLARETFELIGQKIVELTGGGLTNLIDRVLDLGAAFGEVASNQKWINDTWVAIKKWVDLVARIAGSLKNTLGVALEVVFLAIRNIINAISGSGVINNVGDLIEWLGEKIIVVSDKFGEWLVKIRDFLKEHETLKSAIEGIGGAIGGIGGFFGKAIGFVGDFLGKLFGLKEGETIWTAFADIAQKAGEKIRGAFGYIREGLQKLKESGFAEEAAKIFGTVYAVFMSYRKLETVKWDFQRSGRAFEFLKGLLTKTYDFLKAFNPEEWANKIQTLLSRTSGALRAFADNLNAKSLLYIGGAILLLAVGLSVLAAVAESGYMWDAIGALTAISAVLLGFFWAMKKIISGGGIVEKIKNFKDVLGNLFSVGKEYTKALAFQTIAKGLLYVAAAVLVFVLAIGALAFFIKKLDAKNVWMAVGIIAVALVLLIGTILVLNKALEKTSIFGTAKLAIVGVSVMLFAAAILILSAALAVISAVIKRGGWDGIIALALMFIILVGAITILSEAISNGGALRILAAAVAIVLISAAMLVLAAAVIVLTAVVRMGGWDGIIALAVMIALLVGALYLLSGIDTAGIIKAAGAMIAASVAILILSAAVVIITASLLLLSLIPGEQLAASLLAIAAVIVVMTVALYALTALGPMLLVGAAGFLLMAGAIALISWAFMNVSAALVTLSVALNMLEGVDLEGIGQGLIVLSSGLGSAGLGGLIASIGSKGFEALIPLASALLMMNGLNFNELGKGLGEIASGLGKFFLPGIGLLFADGGLALAGPAFLSLASGLVALTPQLERMMNVFGGTKGEEAAQMISKLGAAFTEMSRGAIAASPLDIQIIATAIGDICEALRATPLSSINKIERLGGALASTFTDHNADIIGALNATLRDLLASIDQQSENFVAKGGLIPASIGKGLKNQSSSITIAFVDPFIWLDKWIYNFNSGRWEIHGGNISIGVANGINGKAYLAYNAMNQLAAGLSRSFTFSLDINSPSGVFEHLTGFVPMAVAIALQNGEPQVTKATEQMMAGAMGVMDQYAKNASDISPSVTPVMDMATMRKNMVYADQMWNRSALSSMAGISGLRINGDTINYNMQNKDVVDAITSMNHKIGELGKAIENMQLVMDTGLVVGGLAPAMNNKLGEMAVRERRQ